MADVKMDTAPTWLWWIPIAVVIVIIISITIATRRREEPPPTPTAGIPAAPTTPYDSLINQAAGKYNVPANLIKALIQRESRFNPEARGEKGELGLMQLMPETAQRYGVSNLLDPGQNIEAGTRYIADLLQKYNGNMEQAIAAYNCGEDCVNSGNIPDSTLKYRAEVLALYASYNSGGIAVAAAPPPRRGFVLENPLASGFGGGYSGVPEFEARGITLQPGTTTIATAPVERWSEWYILPPNQVFQLWPEGKARYHFWDGRKVDDEPGKIINLGGLRTNIVRFISREEAPVEVKIVLQSR
jgi:hypothetical protein